MKAVFLDSDTLGNDIDFSPLEQVCPELKLFGNTGGDQVIERARGAHIIITNKVEIDRPTLEALTSVRLIAVTATGVNNIDLAAASAAGIKVCNATAYGTRSVAQHTLCLMLALANRLQEYTRDVRQGEWQQSSQFCLMSHATFELQDKTLGIIGYGETGQAVAQLAEAFGMRVRVAESFSPERATLKQQTPHREALTSLLQEADVISLHCLLSEQTRQLINRERLALMKPGALLINTARGGLIDEGALREALIQGKLGGAALDVLSVEPPPAAHPLLADDIPNLLITPHMAWISLEARQRLLAITAANIAAYRAGAPTRVVN